MSNDGSKKAPPPPPPPPPPLGGLGAVKKLSDMTERERIAWIDAVNGLNITRLKVARYPNDPHLLAVLGAKASEAGKPIADHDTQKQERVAMALQAALKTQLIELFTLASKNKAETSTLIQKIEEKLKHWKSSATGLNDYYDLLSQELPKLKSPAKAAVVVDLSNDPEYQKLRKVKDALEKEYATLNQKYMAASSDKQSAIYEQLALVVKRIDEQRSLIKPFKKELEDAKNELHSLELLAAAPLKTKRDAIVKLESKIVILENPSGYTDPDTKAENQRVIAALRQEIEQVKAQAAGTQEQIASNHAAIAKAQDNIAKYEMKVARANALMTIFTPPESWKAVNNAERKKEQSGQKRQIGGNFDNKGMFLEGGHQGGGISKRKFDARFLDANQLSRLARFFSHHPGEYSISDNNSLLELMSGINGVLGINAQLNFDVLMDIAEGRLKRKPDTFADYSAQRFLDKDGITEDLNRKPNYDKLLQRWESFTNVELNQARDMTVSRGKYNEGIRTIALDYLTSSQMQKLQQFFARHGTDLKTEEGDVDRKAVGERINQLLNVTNITFEDIIDIAEGHLRRKATPAPQEHHTLLLEVQRYGQAPNYEAAIKQRSDYIAELARIKREKQEEKRRLKAEQMQGSIAAMEEKANVFVQTQQEIFEKPFKKRIPDYALDVDDLEEFQLFANVVQIASNQQEDMTPALQEAIHARLKQLNPAVILDTQAPFSNEQRQTTSKPLAITPSRKASFSVQNNDSASNKPIHTDETALRVVRNLLASIDVKTRYKQADVKKKFGFASFKAFQHKDRAEQLKLLDLAVTKARQDMQSDPNAAFSQLERTITSIKKQLDQEKVQGKRKLGDSRLEKVIVDLSREVQGMKSALHATTDAIAKKAPKAGGAR